MMDFSICISNQCSLSNHFLEKEAKFGAKFVMTSSGRCCCCFYSIEQNLVFANVIGREHLNFSLYCIRVYLFYGHRRNPYNESSVSTRIKILSP